MTEWSAVHEDEIDALFRQFDDTLAELQQCDADLPVDDGVSQRQAALREQVRRQQQALQDAGVLSPGQSWWVRLSCATYNLCNYTAQAAPDRAEQRALIGSLGADLLLLQEIKHHDPHDPELAELFAALCADLGMDGRLAIAKSGHHAAVLWRPQLRLRSWQNYRHWPWHHTAGLAELDVGARQPLLAAAAHFSPFSPDQRAHEAQLLGALAPSLDQWMLVGADLNSPSARAPEPYEDQDPRGRHQLHQRIVSPIWPGDSDVAPVDRRAAMILDRHGLRDIADRGPNTPWPMTTGHHPDDPHGPRQPDCLRMTPSLLSQAGGLRVHDTTDARAASDHLPLSTVLTLPWRPSAPSRSSSTSGLGAGTG